MIGVHEIVEYASYKNYLGKKCPYEGSPFQVYKQMSSKVKGAHFEKIFEEYMIAKGYELRKNYNSDHDRVFVVDGEEVKFEVKGSLLWGEEGTSMKWQQIRTDQDYDMIVFMGIFPTHIQFYLSDKETVSKHIDIVDENGYYPYNQHGGKRVRSGTFAIQGMPEDFPFMQPLEERLRD